MEVPENIENTFVPGSGTKAVQKPANATFTPSFRRGVKAGWVDWGQNKNTGDTALDAWLARGGEWTL
jgi:hypothetical protein